MNAPRVLLRRATAGVSFVAFLVAISLALGLLEGVGYSSLLAAVKEISAGQLLLGVLLVFISYLLVSLLDVLAAKSLSLPVSVGQALGAGAVGYTIRTLLGDTIGLGTTERYRLYSTIDLDDAATSRIVVFTTVGSALGYLLAAGVGLALAAGEATAASPGLGEASGSPLFAIGALLAVLAYIVATVIASNSATGGDQALFDEDFEEDEAVTPPGVFAGFARGVISASDLLVGAALLAVLLPAEVEVGFGILILCYLIALFVGNASRIPGGLGVFELVALVLIPAPAVAVIAALVWYRILHVAAPLLAGALVSAALAAVVRLKGGISATISQLRIWLPRVLPPLLAAGTFAAGVILLLGGAIPTESGRLSLLGTLFPIAVIEASYFATSLFGAVLLVVAYGFRRRLDAAYLITVALLAVSAIANLLRTGSPLPSLFILLLIVALLPCRSYFWPRPTRLTSRYFAFRGYRIAANRSRPRRGLPRGSRPYTG